MKDGEREDWHADEPLPGELEDALRRRFAPPADLEARLRAHIPELSPEEQPEVEWSWPVAVLVAASVAVVFLGLGRFRAGQEGQEREAPRTADTITAEESPSDTNPVTPASVATMDAAGDAATDATNATPAWSHTESVGPLERAPAIGERRLMRVDTGALYAEATRHASNPGWNRCEESDLETLLEDAYEHDVALVASPAPGLQGPFASETWRTATVLTGVADGQPAVLIADTNATVDCCIEYTDPEDGLNVFLWKDDDLALMEITPLSEPRLLASFVSYAGASERR